MEPKKLFKILTYLIFFILIVNFLAMKFHWYYSLWYFDMIMHFLGGAWLGLSILWLLFRKEVIPTHVYSSLFLKVAAGVLIFGIGWEIYEFLVDYFIVFNFSRFNLSDTISDILCDFSGGMVALYFVTHIMSRRINTI